MPIGYGYDARGLDERTLMANRSKGDETYSLTKNADGIAVGIEKLNQTLAAFGAAEERLRILITNLLAIDPKIRPDFKSCLSELTTIRAEYFSPLQSSLRP